jgi:hypothetical protein
MGSALAIGYVALWLIGVAVGSGVVWWFFYRR